MEDRLNQIAERLRQVERELADPAVYSDQQRLKNLSREQKELTPVVETFTALQQTEQAIAEAREMLSDQELRELAQEELTRTKEQRERLAEELKRLLLPRDPNDEKSVVLEIRGGVGGEEGALFAADLLRMYTMYAERRCWQLEIVSQNVTELGGVHVLSQSRFSGAVMPQHHHEAALLDAEAHAPQRRLAPLALLRRIGEGQVLCFDHGHILRSLFTRSQMAWLTFSICHSQTEATATPSTTDQPTGCPSGRSCTTRSVCPSRNSASATQYTISVTHTGGTSCAVSSTASHPTCRRAMRP